jgi:hypothetical protein
MEGYSGAGGLEHRFVVRDVEDDPGQGGGEARGDTQWAAVGNTAFERGAAELVPPRTDLNHILGEIDTAELAPNTRQDG